MGATNLVIDVNPNATAYDEDYPTRSTELLNHQLHEMLVDMNDATGDWRLEDGLVNSSTTRQAYLEWIHDLIEDVFDYAEGAIDTYRTSGTPTLSHPAYTDLPLPHLTGYPHRIQEQYKLYQEGMKIMYFIYYMWKTETDPLLLKEKLQELLIAWPLMDTTIDLQTESGQTIRMYPSWKNVDLDL